MQIQLAEFPYLVRRLEQHNGCAQLASQRINRAEVRQLLEDLWSKPPVKLRGFIWKSTGLFAEHQVLADESADGVKVFSNP